MNGLRLSAYFAIIYGLGLGCFETFINWGQWQWWPFWLIDYVAAIFLIFSGITTFKHPNLGSNLLSMAWGFVLAMLWMSLASNIALGVDPNRAARVANLYIYLIIASLVLSLIGLLLTLKYND